MNIFDERIALLQKEMRKYGIRAYIVKATDPHLSESYCDRYGYLRKFFCPFTGQDGTLLVTLDSYYIYTDGRYWVQAEIEVNHSNCQLVREGDRGVPSLVDFIKKEELYPLGIDSSLFSIDELKSYYVDDQHKIVSIDFSYLAKDMPSLPKGKIFRLDDSLLSTTVQERKDMLLKEVHAKKADSILLSSLDEIAWLMGYRGNDIPCTPVFYSFLFVSDDEIHLFIDKNKLPKDDNPGSFIVHEYEEVYSFLKEREDRIAIDPKRTNSRIGSSIKNKVYMTSPAYYIKAVKGPVEIENTIKIHEIDGVAVLKLMKFIDDNIESRDIDELEVCSFLDGVRLRQDLCYDLSFPTIAAVDSNGPMMHYEPTKEKHALFTKDSLALLVDSGGQYYGGTTDITRTFLSKVTPELRHDYTLTLKSQINLSRQIFMRGSSGHTLDITARECMWREGLDYKCGTGHGVSYMGPVHEGPIGFRYYDSPARDDKGILTPGHIITIEPGVYKTGKYGIRLENELLVREAFSTDQGDFLKFETITYCPYDKKGIDISLLTDDELDFLNDYLKMTYEKLSRHIDDPELHSYLKKQCEPFSR